MQIVASASANLSPSEVAAHAIALLPTRMMVDGVEHHVREGYGIADVDRWVKGAREAPHNVGATASELVEILLELSNAHRELLLVLPSHKIIGTYQAALSATRALLQRRSRAGLRVEIAELGSTDCSGALAATYAGEARKAGLPFDAVVAATRAFAAAGRVAIVPRVLDHLVMGGRATFLRAMVADLVGQSPILVFVDGELQAQGSCPRTDPVPAIAASLEAQLGSSRRLWVAVAHGGCEPDAVKLVAELKRRFSSTSSYGRVRRRSTCTSGATRWPRSPRRSTTYLGPLPRRRRAVDSEPERGEPVTWTIEPAVHPQSKEQVWTVKDAPGGTVWAVFYDHVAAEACVRGWKTIGFVPDRPTVEFSLETIARGSKDAG